MKRVSPSRRLPLVVHGDEDAAAWEACHPLRRMRDCVLYLLIHGGLTDAEAVKVRRRIQKIENRLKAR